MNHIASPHVASWAPARRTLVMRALLGLLTAGLLAACSSDPAAPTAIPTAAAVAAVSGLAGPTRAATPAASATPVLVPSRTLPAGTTTARRIPSPTVSPISPPAPFIVPSPTLPPAARTARPIASPTVPAVPAAPPGTPGTPSSSVVSAIQMVIARGNQEQQQAIAAQNPTLMRDTATASYYTQMAQAVTDLVNSAVTAIQLLNLTWGPITLQGATSAQATTVETWSTTFADGSTLQETDTNVYTLVLQAGAWLVQDDQHPHARPLQPPLGTPGAALTPDVPASAPGTDQSNNWAGYAATGGPFTAVSGTWTIPTIGTTNGLGADATWVGIGGANSTDLIQAGTDASIQAGQTIYTAWWETLPQAAQPVPMTVAAGDTMRVSITQQTSGTWQIVITDSTRQASFQTRLTYASSRSSAEWIEEAPTAGRRWLLPLDNFGSVSVTQATTVENGRARTIAQAGGKPITMYAPGGQALAVPSALGAEGASFTVTRTNVPAPRIVPGPGGGRRVP